MTGPTDGFITGVFNYCDRWCERCPLSSRCRLFADEQREGRDTAQELADGVFWERLTEKLREHVKMLEALMEEEGIVMTEEDHAQASREIEASRVATTQHPLYAASLDYLMRAKRWLDEHEDELVQAQALAQVSSAEPDTPDRIAPAVEVIERYATLQVTKLYRALEELVSSRDDPESDNNGSAKVALITMDRSIGAWMVLRDELPAEEDSILDLLLVLDRLRRVTEQTFPLARAFVRPGFDT